MSQITRQLAAILFADIVGYTYMMGKDEDHAFQVLDHFKKIAIPLVEKHKGTWHKDLGDGALCSFGSALDAVNGAIVIQQTINQETPIKVRIGIHLGDVTFQNGDVFGDGVNVASRMQSEAAPGGICLSEPVYKSVRNKGNIKTVFLGKKKLKNVDGLMSLYQISSPGVEIKQKGSLKEIHLKWAILIMFGLVGLTSLFWGWYFRSRNTAPSANIERYEIVLPEANPLVLVGSSHLGLGFTALAISPDGKLLVYAGQEGQTTRLFVRPIDSYEVTVLTGTDGAYFPFFSPDSEWIGFFSGGSLKKISVKGGTPIILCEASNPSGATWTTDNRIYFSDDEGISLNWIHSEGGDKHPVPVEEISRGFQSLNNVSLLGEDHLLITSVFPRGIYAISLDGGKRIKLLDRGEDPYYLSSGHLTYVEQGRLMAVPFDMKSISVSGKIISVIHDLRTESNTSGQATISNEGTLVYVPGVSALESQLVFLSKDGKEEVLSLPSDYYGASKISPDGKKLSISNLYTGDLSVFDLENQSMTRLTNDGQSYKGGWSPDGKEIIFQRVNRILQINASGFETPTELLSDSNNLYIWDYSNDGKVLMYGQSDPVTSQDIKFHFLNQEMEDFKLLPDRANQILASFSPSTDFIAYTSNESGQSEVYVQPFPPNGDRWTISSGGGEEPLWSPQEDLLYYRNGNDWMEVPISLEPNFSAGTPRLLFSGPYINVPDYSYDIHPDGERFLLFRPVSQERTATRLKVVRNWFEEVKRLAPSD